MACGGSGEKRRGPYDAAAAEDVARDGGAKTEETGKRKRQSSERFIAGGAARAQRFEGMQASESRRSSVGSWGGSGGDGGAGGR